uniref:hypothetical protein n=1 Tax=Candidatus Fimenecus sp. TaxID=3022888 RepID=UPI0040269745
GNQVCPTGQVCHFNVALILDIVINVSYPFKTELLGGFKFYRRKSVKKCSFVQNRVTDLEICRL